MSAQTTLTADVAALEVGLDRAAEHLLRDLEDPERKQVERRRPRRRGRSSGGARRRCDAEREARREAAEGDPEACARVGDASTKCDGGVSRRTAALVRRPGPCPPTTAAPRAAAPRAARRAPPVSAPANAVAGPPPRRKASPRSSERSRGRPGHRDEVAARLVSPGERGDRPRARRDSEGCDRVARRLGTVEQPRSTRAR